VTRAGTEYVVATECDSVRVELRGSPRSSAFKPASGQASGANISTFAIEGLPVDEVIAIEGPREVICPDGRVPGHGVAFSSKTDAETTARRIASIGNR
jgi:hypothetical protein